MSEGRAKGSRGLILVVVALLGYGVYQLLSERRADPPAPKSASATPQAPHPQPAPPPTVESIPIQTTPPPQLAPVWQPPVIPTPTPYTPPPEAARAVRVPEATLPWIDAPGSTRVGEHVTVTVNVDTRSNSLNTVLVRLRFDVAKLRLQSVGMGDFMNQRGVPGTFAHDDSAASGDVAVSLHAESGESVQGRGSIAIFDFEAIEEGAADIEIQSFEAQDVANQSVQTSTIAPQSISIDP